MSEEIEVSLPTTRQGTGNEVFGIDLGTTYSAIAWLDSDGRPAIIQNVEGEDTTPSAVFFNSDTEMCVGNTAKDQGKFAPGQLATFIKRHMGEKDFFFTPKAEDGTPIGKSWSPVDVSAIILGKLEKDASQMTNCEVKNVVITCPAYFGTDAHQAVKSAGEGIGLNVLHVINEPTAAAIARSTEIINEDKTILVYDLGGGTFDVTVLQIKDKKIKVVCSGGDKELGGKDWDEAFAKFLNKKWQEATGSDVDLMASVDTSVELMLDAEKYKKQLTGLANIRVNLAPNGQKRASFTVSRDEFDELTADLLGRTISTIESVQEEAAKALGVDEFHFDELLMVGGSSLMPQVLTRLRDEFHVEPILFKPNQAVALGAAIYPSLAEIINPGPVPVTPPEPVEEVINKSYGIIAKLKSGEDAVYNLLLKNTPLKDAKHSHPFPIRDDNAISIQIKVTESEDGCYEAGKEKQERISEPALATILNTCSLKLPAAGKKGDIIDVTFEVDDNMVLHISAVHRESGEKIELTLEAAVQKVSFVEGSLVIE
ncbi:MAG: Hsp70 family protein [Victivallales bacterium]|nr:Hsp70 family protein [Victivallales bacterium]